MLQQSQKIFRLRVALKQSYQCLGTVNVKGQDSIKKNQSFVKKSKTHHSQDIARNLVPFLLSL